MIPDLLNITHGAANITPLFIIAPPHEILNLVEGKPSTDRISWNPDFQKVQKS